MVEIRRLTPLVKMKLPERYKGYTHTLVVMKRTNKDFPPPTPQDTPCRLWQGSVDPDGYGRFKRKVHGTWKTVKLHRWIVETLEGRKLLPEEFILHACDNPPCYRVDHLMIGTVQDNNADMFAKGRAKPPPINRLLGERNGNAKLDNMQRAAVIAKYRGGLSQTTIAAEYGVSPSTISKIVQPYSRNYTGIPPDWPDELRATVARDGTTEEENE